MTIMKIDMHLHSHFSGGPERLRKGTWPTPPEVRKLYDELSIDKGVQMSRYAPERMHDPITSRDAQKLAETYPETIGWWFCALDPRMANNSSEDDLSYYLDFFKERGAKGVGEMQATMYIDDPRMMNLLSHCEKANMPVTIHFGTKGSPVGIADDLGLPRLDKILTAFPKLKILGHAPVFWSEISADVDENNRNSYQKGRIEKEGRLWELLRKHKNLYCDMSAGSGLNAFTRDKETSYKFIEEFHERILFATDLSSPTTFDVARQISAFLDDGYSSGNISFTAYKNICRDNAINLLG